MQRREFLAYGSAAAAATAFIKAQTDQPAEAQTAVSFELAIEEIYEEMIDGEVLFALAYRDTVSRTIRPPLFVTEGQTVTIRLINRTRKPRQLGITGFVDGKFSSVQPNAAKKFTFIAPVAGSYIYHDISEGAGGRVVGLHGPLIVMPTNGRTAAGTQTPYSSPTLAQAAIFDALGTSSRFPGEPWRGDLPERNFIWLFNSIDPAVNQDMERNLPIDKAALKARFTPRYFTMNGLSGYDSSHDASCCPEGYEGEPVLIRTMNAGYCTHGPHIHGNHVYPVSECVPTTLKQYKCYSVTEVDTWMLKPLWRKDVILPFIKPDEIPAAAWPPKGEPFPLFYPMHCHMEMSQTAGGGSYPQGMVTHWEMLGPRRGV
jgi:Multicopper oxidase